jgi:ubiquinone biosynthesis protein COQ4
MIAVLGETTGDFALRAMQKSMLDCAEGREILQQRPRVDATTLNLSELSKLPSNTFGFHYAQFMNSHGFDPQDRAAVRFVSDPDLAYVLQRYREAHDFWHVLCDVPIDVSGELALKWLEMLQTGQPMTAIASLFGPLRLSWAERARFRQHFIPWAIQCNRALNRALITVFYEKYMQMDIDEVRKLLGVIVVPRLTM